MNPDKLNGKITPIEQAMALDHFISQIPIQTAYHIELSKLYKARYDSLVAAGFKEQQALDIVKARGFE